MAKWRCLLAITCFHTGISTNAAIYIMNVGDFACIPLNFQIRRHLYENKKTFPVQQIKLEILHWKSIRNQAIKTVDFLIRNENSVNKIIELGSWTALMSILSQVYWTAGQKLASNWASPRQNRRVAPTPSLGKWLFSDNSTQHDIDLRPFRKHASSGIRKYCQKTWKEPKSKEYRIWRWKTSSLEKTCKSTACN